MSLVRIKGWVSTVALALAAAAFVFAAPVSAQLPGADAAADVGAVSAQDLGLYYGNQIGLGQSSLQDTIARIIRVALSLLGIVAVVIIIAGGVRWMTAGGDQDKVSQAKKIILNGTIGLAIILSSYAITQFVINSLLTATTGDGLGGQQEGVDGGGLGFGGGCNNPPCGGNNFVAKISPKGQQRIQNVVVKINFQERGRAALVDQATVVWPESIKVFKTEQPDVLAPMDVAFISESEIHLSPTGACPEPHQERLECLEADTSYTVQITTAVQEAQTERSLHCPLTNTGAFSCSKVFVTGNEFDAEAPTVKLLSHRHGGSVQLGDEENLRARARDNMGVDIVQFSINEEVVYTADPEDNPERITENYVWEVDPELYQPLEPVRISVSSRDVDGNIASTDPISLIPRPAHCFNDEQDEDEEGEDCGGAWCGACQGNACERDADCAGGFCQIDEGEQVGICIDKPVITGINPEDGAPGTLVTVSGEHFGDAVGSVVFYTDPEDPNARVVAPASACGVQWSAESITVMVPSELQEGVSYPLGVIAGNLSDRSDDDFGASFDDVFAVTDALKPGLCSIDPDSGVINDVVTVRGINLGDGDGSGLLFGGQRSRVQNWEEDRDGDLGSITAFIPNISAGLTGVQAQVGEEKSNALDFRVRAFNDQDRPTLAAISPASGPSGTYITLSGSGFGRADQGSVVIFEDKVAGDTFQADTQFPAVCTDGTYNDTTIVVKVPEGVREAEHNVYVRLGGSLVESLPVDFGVSGGDPPPGVCKVDPNMRGVGGWIDVYGEYFGDGGTVRFWTEGSVGDPITWAPADNNVVGSVWGADDGNTIKVTVPADAVSGPVLVLRDDAAISNQTPFTVGSCHQNNNQCPVEGQTCCASGFHAGSCQDSCEEVARESEYAWIFSTGKIPTIPGIVECCGRNCPAYNELPSPSPWASHRDSETVCSNAMIRGTITTEIDLQRDDPTQKIVLEQCVGEPEDRCSEFLEIHRGAEIINGAGFSEFQFSGEHKPALIANATYQVRIEAGMFARSNDNEGIVGGAMPENPAYVQACGGEDHADGTAYCFRFNTDASQCVLSAVTVVPTTFTAREFGFLVQEDENHVISELQADSQPLYRATPISDNSCVALDAEEYDWEWRSNTFRARVMGDGPAGSDTQHVRAQVATEDRPAIISAIASGVQGSGELLIIPDKPRIITAWPQCQSMCVNGEMGISFNVPMRSIHFSPFTVGIFECENELCDLGEDITNFGIWAQNNKVRFAAYADQEGAGFASYEKHTVKMTLSEDLEPDTFYRVMVRGLVSSAEGAALFMTEDEYDYKVGEGIINSYKSFTFRTAAAGANCAIETVGVTPKDKAVSALGVKQLFVGTAMGENNGCGPDGGRQRLNADNMSWMWQASHDMVEIEVFDVQDEPSPGCSAQCTMIGSEGIQYVCGNGRIDSGEDCDDPNDPFCTDQCLFVGATPECLPDDEGVVVDITECPVDRIVGADPCGNGQRDAGEQCDDGNKVSGDGCSTLCMAEGSRSTGVTCGNREVAPGEGCDDGNTRSGDGCSNQCIKEGTPVSEKWCSQGNNNEQHDICAVAISVCGNNHIETGEECDDGNLLNNDACSDQCLFSGGTEDSCGNGELDIDLGEQCDGGEGCSANCRWLGSSLSYENPSICGDGLGVGGRAGTGENPRCEAGAQGDGQSDPVIVAHMSHIPDDRLQDLVDQAVAGEDKPRIENTITATARYGNAEAQSAEAIFALECGYTQQTNPQPENYGVGAGGCLYPYPEFNDPHPTGEGACRNPLLTINSDTGFDKKSLDGNIFLAIQRELCEEGEIVYGDRDDAQGQNVAWKSVMRLALSGLRALFGLPVNAQEQQDLRWCASPLNARYEVVDDGESQQLRIMPLSALAPDSRYRVILVGNTAVLEREREESIRDGSGTPLNGNFDQWQFSTGTDICTLDEVAVSPSTWMFGTTARETGPLCSQETADQICGEDGLCVDANDDGVAHCDLSRHHFTTTAYTGRDALRRPISPIEGVYDWTYKWGPRQDSIVEIETGLQEDENVSDDREIRLASKPGESGEETLSALATITADDINQNSHEGNVIVGSSSITVSACDNPWPPLFGDGPTFPYEDVRHNLRDHFVEAVPGGIADLFPIGADPGEFGPADAGEEDPDAPPAGMRRITTNDDLIEDRSFFTNFSTWYCRDQGDAGDDDDLPALDPFVEYHNANADPQMLKRIHFRNAVNNDLIGIMVRSNPDWLTLSQWYADAFPGQGNLTPLPDVDGFEAGRLGNTLYVSAINYLPESGQMFSNIYIFSISGPNGLLPSKESQEIFQQMVDNLVFVANVSQYNRCSLEDNQTPDPEGIRCTYDNQCAQESRCLSSRDKLKRDLVRMEHAAEVAGALRAFRSGNGNFPLLTEGTAGSFVPQMTVSGWSSWQAALGNAVGVAMPEDPGNAFVGCSEAGADPATCWNDQTQQFTCNTRSHFYEYRTNSNGSNAELNLKFEHFDVAEDNQVGENLQSLSIEGLNVGTAICGGGDGQVVAAGVGICGNNIREGGEFCDDNQVQGSFCGFGFKLAGNNHFFSPMLTATRCNSQCSEREVIQAAVGRCTGDTSYECSNDDQCRFNPGRNLGRCERIVPGNGCYFNSELAAINPQAQGGQCGNGVVESGELCEPGGTILVLCHPSNWIKEAPGGGASLSEVVRDTLKTYNHMGCNDDCRRYQAPGEILVKRCSDSAYQRCNSDLDCVAGRCIDQVGEGSCFALDELSSHYGNLTERRNLMACGDGQVDQEANEICDTGWARNGQYGGYCSGLCNSEPTRYCGDGRIDAPELCDLSVPGGANRTRAWAEDKEDSCSESCMAYGSYCGDGTLDRPHEECDDGNKDSGDGCSSICEEEEQEAAQDDGQDLDSFCGNGVINDGEQCDQGDKNGIACNAEYGGQCAYCSANCQNVLFASGGFCGDNQTHARDGEVCDGSDVNVGAHICQHNVYPKPGGTPNLYRCNDQCSSFEGGCRVSYTDCVAGVNCIEAGLRVAAVDGNTVRVLFGKRHPSNDMSDEIYEQGEFDGGWYNLDFEALKPGIYTLRVELKDSELQPRVNRRKNGAYGNVSIFPGDRMNIEEINVFTGRKISGNRYRTTASELDGVVYGSMFYDDRRANRGVGAIEIDLDIR